MSRNPNVWICLLVALLWGQRGASAEGAQAKPPVQLLGKSITISYLETRRSKPEQGGELTTRSVPFRLIVYVSREGNIFNRLLPGRTGKSSDQTRGSQDITNFASRDTTFDKQKMSVSNTFGGGKGLRMIEATFDQAFASCNAAVSIKIEGEHARRRLIQGGFELLYSAETSEISCTVSDGNLLAS